MDTNITLVSATLVVEFSDAWKTRKHFESTADAVVSLRSAGRGSNVACHSCGGGFAQVLNVRQTSVRLDVHSIHFEATN